MRRVFSLSGGILVLIAVAGACSSYGDNGTAPPVGGGDAAVDGATTSNGEHDADAVDAGSDGPVAAGCPDKIIYVAEAGSDLNTGCTTDKPKHTIGGAIGFAQVNALVGHEIHVCRGTYPEAVTLNYPVSIRGGYECATWKRGTNLFDTTNQTLLKPVGVGNGFTVTGKAVDATVTVEALTIVAPDLPTGDSIGIVVTDHAAPRLSSVEARAGSPGEGGSLALRTDLGAGPAIDHAVLRGGAAKCTSATCPSTNAGGALFAADSGEVSIVDSEIHGASVNATISTFTSHTLLTYVKLTGARAFARNKLFWPSGGAGSYGTQSYAIDAQEDMDLVDVDIEPEAVGPGPSCTSATKACAITALVVGKYVVNATRLRVGDPKLAGGSQAARNGLQAQGGTLNITASALYMSSKDVNTPSRVFIATSDAPATINARGNTFVASELAYSEAAAIDLRDNVFVHLGNVGSPALGLYDCNGTATVSLHDNAFVERGATFNLLSTFTTAACTSANPDVTSLADLQTQLGTRARGSVADNVIVRTKCDGEVAKTCIACASADAATCVLADWTGLAAAPAQLAKGFPLRSDVACEIATGAASDLDTVSRTDVNDLARTAPSFAMGASELDRTCP